MNTAGLRRVFVLTKHLPPEAALWAVYKQSAPAASLDELDQFFGRNSPE